MKMSFILFITIFTICSIKTIEPFPQILSESQLFVDSDICDSIDCQNTGIKLKSNLNTSVDPCDDFYEFACGGWMSSHTIPEGKSYVFGDQELELNIKKKINESLSKISGKSEPKTIVFASELYKSCLDIPTRDSKGINPLKDALGKIEAWPLANGSFNETTFDWQDTFAKMIQVFSYAPLFVIGVAPDVNDTKVNRFYFNPGGFGMGREQLVDHVKWKGAIDGYKQRILHSALLIGAKNDSQTLKQIDEIVAFEGKLSNATAPEGTLSRKNMYNRMTFKAFNKLTDNRVDWIKLMNNIYEKLNSSVRVSSEELVIVPDVNYYKTVIKLLETTPKRTLANYFGHVAVFSFEWLTRKAGTPKPPQLWNDCINYVGNVLDTVLSRLYVETSFTKTDKQEASVLVKVIKDSFDKLITWGNLLDGKTGSQALIKLKAIQENVGYPDWILDDTLLDNYYNLTRKADPKNFFENMLYVKQRSILTNFNQFRAIPNKNTSWPTPPHVVNAMYMHTQNSITIPAAQLLPPYFNAKLPAQINYGAIGPVVGHELTHGFDTEGSQYDANGNFRNWWTEEASKRFKTRAECFVKQYSSILDTQTQLKLNGKNTLAENIADNGGLREAYDAYEKYTMKGRQHRLPNISNYSPDQQFFISYANSWCSKYKTEYLKDYIKSNPHSPAKYRVNIPLSNFKTFSDVFKCSTNSRMNIKNKCVLW